MIKIQDCIIWEYIMTKFCLFQVLEFNILKLMSVTHNDKIKEKIV